MPAIAGAAVIGGTVLSGMFGRSSARKSMSFQREMAQKAHQYEVADLRAAGLNPILSGMGGQGARASGGAMPQTPQFSAAALAALKLKAEVDLIKANTSLTDAKADLIAPTSAVASDAEKVYQWIKKGAPSTAKEIIRLIKDYPGQLVDGVLETQRKYLAWRRGNQPTGRNVGKINVNPPRR